MTKITDQQIDEILTPLTIEVFEYTEKQIVSVKRMLNIAYVYGHIDNGQRENKGIIQGDKMTKLELETIIEKIDMQVEALNTWRKKEKETRVKVNFFTNQLVMSIDYLKTKLEGK